jgi:hypothetical protein
MSPHGRSNLRLTRRQLAWRCGFMGLAAFGAVLRQSRGSFVAALLAGVAAAITCLVIIEIATRRAEESDSSADR